MEPKTTEDAYHEGGMFFKPDFGVAEWEALKLTLPIGSIITGKVVHQAPFGVFIDAGLGFPVLLDISSFGYRETRFPDDYLALHSELTGELFDFTGVNSGHREIRIIPINPSGATYR